MTSNNKSNNIEILQSDPKKSIIRLAPPVIVTMLATSLYNVVDGIWIAGLGQSAIAGIGLVTPLWMIINGVSNGLAHGATSAVSRHGSHNKEMAEKTAEHSMAIFIIGAILLTIVLLAVLVPYVHLFDLGEETAQAAYDYAIPLFIGLAGFTMSCGCAGLLRAEGDTKRPMYALSLGVILNGCLDPVFIYTLKMGAAGASVSTIVTSLISALVMLYWLFVKKDTFYRINLLRTIKPQWDRAISKDILSTGIPVSLELLMLSFASFLFYSFILTLGGDLGASVFSSGHRLYLFNLLPVTAISQASVAIVGTHFGKGDINNVRRTHSYSCLYATVIGLFLTLLIIIFADQLAHLFALTSDDQQLISGISDYIKITALCVPFLGVGLPSTFFYMGIGKGKYSLMWTTINEVVCSVPATYLLGFVLGMGLEGIWWGFVLGRGIACLCNFIFTRYKIKKLHTPLLASYKKIDLS